MNEAGLRELLGRLQAGELDVETAMARLKHWPTEIIEGARLDHHRLMRTGVPEVVFGENKSVEQLVEIMGHMMSQAGIAMATRVSLEKAEAVCLKVPELSYQPIARMLTGGNVLLKEKGRGVIVVLTAGTSDIPVGEEAALTAQFLGNQVERVYDVGVAGIHRLYSQLELLAAATVLIVVAGMEGALPSVVGGLVDKPVIAVPTSVGYGTGWGGFAALLGMLNSCTPGVAVVNIDNGFGAGCIASAINRG